MNPKNERHPERVAKLVKSYLEADYRWTMEGDWHDLRIGLQAPGLELVFPDSATFGFLSAWNPWSMERSEEQNRAADEVLHAALRESGLPLVAAFASAPNRSWREPSWVVMGLPVEQFDRLSRQFDQLGTLWWTPGQPVRLRVHAACPESLKDQRNVDWLA